MQRILIATLMALFFGLFSMPGVQAAPANGWAIGSAVKAVSPPLDMIYYRRRRYRRYRRRRYRGYGYGYYRPRGYGYGYYRRRRGYGWGY
jgi:hypothetical protein